MTTRTSNLLSLIGLHTTAGETIGRQSSVAAYVRCCSALVAIFALAVSLAAPSISAAETTPSWMALPDETVLLLRLPGGKEFIEALRKQTKLGAVLLSPERLERLTDILREQSPAGWDTAREALGRIDLKVEDWRSLFNGELGAALTVHPRGDRPALLFVLGWLEPGEELAPRLITALTTILSEGADEPLAAQRKDMELAGHEVIHIEVPVTNLSMPELPEANDDDGDSEEEINQQVERFQARLKQAKLVQSDRTHVFVTRLGGRIVFGCTIPQLGDEVSKKSDTQRAAIDWDTLTGLEEATAAFGRYLSEHAGAGHLPQLMRAAGLKSSLPGGTPLLEIMADPRPLLPLIDKTANPRIRQLIESSGAEGLGPIALRLALEGTVLRSGGLVSMPGPRAGLLGIIDQKPLEPEPPAWVPANAVGYQQLALDLGNVYERLKTLVVDLSGDQGRQSFDQMESVVKAFVQADLRDLLGSLDRRISVVSFAPRMAETHKADEVNDDATETRPQLMQRMGIVCQVEEEELWRKVLQAGGRLLESSGLKSVEEQGFQGYRLEQEGNHLGVFLGNGFLVVGIGPEVSESLLSVLRTPPEGAAALRTSGLVERGRALVSPQPCLIYELEDAGAGIRVTRQTLESLLNASFNLGAEQVGTHRLGGPTALSRRSGAAPDPELLKKLKTLLPSDAELEGLMGVSVSQTIATDDGLLLDSAVELPAP